MKTVDMHIRTTEFTKTTNLPSQQLDLFEHLRETLYARADNYILMIRP